MFKEWEIKAAKGVIKQIKKSINTEGKLPERWKNYLKGMSKNSLECLKSIEPDFMKSILDKQ